MTDIEEKAMEQRIKTLLHQSRKLGEEVIITMPVVIEGLKFIAENQTLSQEELAQGLIDIGCNFTFEEIEQQLPKEVGFASVARGSITMGATIIANVRDSYFGHSYCYERFIAADRECSIYQFIRHITGDENYTKENIEKAKKNGRGK